MALSAAKNTPSQGDHTDQYPVANFPGSPFTIYAGAIVAIWTGAGAGAVGKAVQGRAVTCRAVGVAERTVVCDAAGKTVDIARGKFFLKNSGTAPVLESHVGGLCYIEDDETVCATDTNAKAGTVRRVTPAGVWVLLGTFTA